MTDWTRGVGAFGLVIAEVLSRNDDHLDFYSRLMNCASRFVDENPWFIYYLKISEPQWPFSEYHDEVKKIINDLSLLPSLRWPRFFAECKKLSEKGWRPSLETVEGLAIIYSDEFENPKHWVDELVAPKLPDDRTSVVTITTYFVEGRAFDDELSARTYAAEMDLVKDLSAKYLHQTDALPHRVVDALRESRGTLCHLVELWGRQDRASGSGV